MLYIKNLEDVIKNFCSSNGKSFEAIMHVLTNTEEDFSEIVVNMDSSTEVITIDGHKRGSVLLSNKHTFLKLS